jgi:hypothetical protein
MSCKIQKAGKRFLAEMLAGSGRRIDGMYVEYGNVPKRTGLRDREYFDNLSRQEDAGYVRLSVANSYVDDNLASIFTAMVRLQDTRLADADSTELGCVTLVSEGRDERDDVLVCTFDFDESMKIVGNAYTTIRCGISMWS